MKPLFEKVPLKERTSFLVRRFQAPYIDAPWHYHPEYEIAYILKGYGKRFVGDNVENFSEGDLILIGSNLPHFWRCDNVFYKADTHLETEWLVIQFEPAWLNALQLSPEMVNVAEMLRNAQRGIHFSSSFSKKFSEKLLCMSENSNPAKRLIAFLDVLEALTHDTDARFLASEGYVITPNDAENERMKRILEYVSENFQQEIHLDEIANVAHLSPSAFCRYFKQRTKKTFVDYLNEIRVSHARKLLIDNALSVAQIGLECGFYNLSHFHRQFKKTVGSTPLKYQKEYKG